MRPSASDTVEYPRPIPEALHARGGPPSGQLFSRPLIRRPSVAVHAAPLRPVASLDRGRECKSKRQDERKGSESRHRAVSSSFAAAPMLAREIRIPQPGVSVTYQGSHGHRAQSAVHSGLGFASGFTFKLQDCGGHGQEALVHARDQLLGLASESPMLVGVRPEGQEDAPSSASRSTGSRRVPWASRSATSTPRSRSPSGAPTPRLQPRGPYSSRPSSGRSAISHDTPGRARASRASGTTSTWPTQSAGVFHPSTWTVPESGGFARPRAK